jgi:Peptidase family M28
MAEPHQQADPSSEVEARGSGWPLALMLALFALALALVAERHRAPAPRPAGAPAAEFSAGRAREVLRQLVGDGRPHPVGSAADERVRQRIAGILGGLGYQPRIEEGFACHPGGSCARVRNVVARLEGREPGAAVAIAAHYDSVEAGPGASDDLAGVAAILEIARALKAGPPPRHAVLLLLDEGEEPGLLGAAAFEESSPEAGEVKAVVNLEARGTSGPSYMFETSGENGWLIDAWAPRAPRPVTTSLAAALYAAMPNDTDLTVFRHHGVPGLNFAFIGGAARYHTPYDDFAHASPASLQHQGDNALAAVTGLAEAAAPASPPRGKLVFFDVLSLGVARWPLGWTPWLAALALLLVLAAAVAALARRTLGGGDLVLGLLALPATLLGTGLLALALSLALRASGALAVAWLARPHPAFAAFCLLGLTVAAAMAPLLGRGSAPLGLWAGIWIVWAALGLALAVWAPAASYVFVVPALAAGVCGVLGGIWRRSPPQQGGGGRRRFPRPGRHSLQVEAASGVAAAMVVASVVPGVVAAVLWLSVLPSIYDGLGVPALPLVAVLSAIVCSTLAPLVAAGGTWGRRLWGAGLALTLVAVVMALAQPRFTLRSPQSLTFTFQQDAGTGSARWVVRGLPPLPAAVRAAGAWGPPGRPFPWSPAWYVARSAPAPALADPAAAAPELQVVASSIDGGKRHLRLRLVSWRGAAYGTVWVPAAARPEAVAVEGHPVPARGWRTGRQRPAAGDWLAYSDLTLPAAGCELDLVLGETAAVEVYVVDSTPGLPPAGAALLAARPPTAVPQHQGDTTLVSRKVKI